MSIADWIGRTESRVDTVTAAPMAALSATLDRDDPVPRQGDPLPLLWHWLYFLPTDPQSTLAPDGHARLGGFLPPVALQRRMYAGGRVELHHALRVGDPIRRTSRIVDVAEKTGRSGPLTFVRVRHEISSAAGLALVEDHDIVYRDSAGREAPRPVETAPGATDGSFGGEADWMREIVPDEALLFRYSALTFNAYRIHYDRDFAVAIQGYQGLVVHAPLVATLLADLLRRSMADPVVSTFSFRALQPIIDGRSLALCGRRVDAGRVALWARVADGSRAFEATAALRSG